MANLGFRRAVGIAGTAVNQNRIVAGGWIITFRPEDLPGNPAFEMWHAAITGPGGYFLVYLDDYLYGVGGNGSINEYAPGGSAMYIMKGQTVTLHWSLTPATGPGAPVAYIYLREPEVGRI